MFIDNIKIEFVQNFNLLGICLNQRMSWKNHINTTARKISRSIGILYRLKHFFPPHIKLMIYNTLILSHLNYGLLSWRYNADRIYNLQKIYIRIIGLMKYYAHTEPLFKSFKLLKVADIFKLQQLKFYFNLLNNK